MPKISLLDREITKAWLEQWIRFVQANARSVLCVSVVLAVISVGYSFLCLGYKTDRTDLVSDSAKFQKDWKRFENEFGNDCDVILVVEGNDKAKMIAAIETMARDLAAHPKHFHKICYRMQTDRLRSKGLYQLSVEELQQINGNVQQLGPLLAGTWQFLNAENVLITTKLGINNLTASQPLDAKSKDLLVSTTRLIESYDAYLRNPSVYRSPWKDLFVAAAEQGRQTTNEYFFSDDGRIAFVRAIPFNDPGSFEGAGQAIKIARTILGRVEKAFPELEFGMTGMPVLENDEMVSTQRDSTASAILSFFGTTILFIVGFRAFRHPIYAVLALFISGCWTMGWVTLTVGHLNLLSVSFLVTLVGLGFDYGIIWLSRYEAGLACGHSDGEAGRETAVSIGPGILIGGITTALAFIATMTTDFLGLKELGWIAASGVVLCLLGSFTVLPALLTLGGNRQARERRSCRDALPAFPWMERSAPALLVVSIAVVAFLGWHANKVKFDYNLLNLQAHDLPSVVWEKKLIEQTGTSGWYALSIADSREEVAEMKAKFEALSTTGRVVEIASLIPENQEEKTPIIQQIHALLKKLPKAEEIGRLKPPAIGGIRESLLALVLRTKSCHPDDRVIVEKLCWSASHLLGQIDKVAAGPDRNRIVRLTADFEAQWVSDLVSRLWELKGVSLPEPVTTADLPPALAERYHSKNGKWLLQIFAKESVWDYGPLAEFRAQVYQVDPHVTGKPISTLGSLEQMTSGYQRSTLISAAIVFIAVLIDLRRLSDAFLACIPLAIGVLVMLGTMGWLGMDLNPANLIALPLVLGIGIDSGVHVLHEYRSSRGSYFLSRQLLRGLYLTGLANIVGFASLMIGKHHGVVSIGQTLTIGITACEVAAILVLPSILYLMTRKAAVNPTVLELPASGSQRLAA